MRNAFLSIDLMILLHFLSPYLLIISTYLSIFLSIVVYYLLKQILPAWVILSSFPFMIFAVVQVSSNVRQCMRA